MKIKVGLLDFGIRDEFQNTASIVESVVDLAIRAETLGFHRYWLGEHFVFSVNAPWFSPDMVLPLIAAHTSFIRIGIAGVLTNYMDPVRTASNYKLLNTVFNNRVDLGFAKGAPSKQFLKYFNQQPLKDFEEGLQRFQDHLDKVRHLFNDDECLKEDILLSPYKGANPSLWNLGGSSNAYGFSKDNQLNCSRSLFHQGVSLEHSKVLFRQYKEEFYAEHGSFPLTNIALAGSVNDSPHRLKRIVMDSEKNNDFFLKETRICERPDIFKERVLELLDRFECNEFIFYNISRDLGEIKDSLTILSETFGLEETLSIKSINSAAS